LTVAYFIFVGDMLVMAFMTLVVVWVLIRSNATHHLKSARIPLEDEDRNA
jgi:hypothetical protein